MEPERVYLVLLYPLSGKKYINVGLFAEHDYEVYVSLVDITRQRRVLLDIADWNIVALFRDRITSGLQRPTELTYAYGEGETLERERLKNIIVKHDSVRVKNNKNRTFIFTGSEWTRVASLSHLLCK